MPDISVVIITFNEEKNIGRCLDSVQGIAEDIVVIDSFSTDATRAICLEKGARFVEHAFEGHIEQKNWAITQARFPHILSLDADEALDDTLRQSILEVKKNWNRDGYRMNRLTNYCGQWIRHCGWYPDTKLRLWDSRKGSWTGINPHDEFKLNASHAALGFLKGDILHYSYYSREDHYRQVNYFTDILAREYDKKGRTGAWYKLILNPAAKFLGDYFLKLGLLDGKAGFSISRISAYATWLKYSKLRKLQHAREKN
ncbi:MAG TPA: glycosyltransferase family 2 protein [Bacteroidia bacterium]|jgi:glycosyltransferase involved in cell wall biosynthesis|nr:glycosyltransferase family 2 protein [Bacteroidia bacterium]